MVWNAAASALGTAVGAFMGNKSMAASAAAQREANQTNIMLSREQQDFQERMSNTSYQRGVADLKAANLNPMLAYTQAGASTPTGASTDVKPEHSPQSFASAMGAIDTMSRVGAQIAQMRHLAAETDLTKAKTLGEIENTTFTRHKTNTESFKGAETESRTHLNNLQADQLKRISFLMVDKLRAEVAHTNQSANQIASQNLAVKSLMENPQTRPLAPFLQLFLGK